MAQRNWKDDVIDRQRARIDELESQIYNDWLGRRLKNEYYLIRSAIEAGDNERAQIHLKMISLLDDKGRIPLDADIDPLYRTVDDLDFSVRTYNCLKRANVITVDQMIELSFDEYMHIRNLGKKSYLEIKEKLARFGFKLEDPAD